MPLFVDLDKELPKSICLLEYAKSQCIRRADVYFDRRGKRLEAPMAAQDFVYGATPDTLATTGVPFSNDSACWSREAVYSTPLLGKPRELMSASSLS